MGEGKGVNEMRMELCLLALLFKRDCSDQSLGLLACLLASLLGWLARHSL